MGPADTPPAPSLAEDFERWLSARRAADELNHAMIGRRVATGPPHQARAEGRVSYVDDDGYAGVVLDEDTGTLRHYRVETLQYAPPTDTAQEAAR